MNALIDILTNRLRVLRTWGSFGRVAAWVVFWCLAIGWAVAPARPSPEDRERVPDNPPSDVRYLGPVSRQDLAGFIAPTPRDDAFTVAWIGGSEVKLRSVSVPAETSVRIRSFGGQPVQFDSYSVIAPRPIDALRAIESATANGADAIVVSLNPVWSTDEWSMRDWPNMDVSGLGTLWSDPSSWLWAAALTSPADVSLRVSRAAFPMVEAQNHLNEIAQEWVEKLDVVERPEPVEETLEIDLDPRLPVDATNFWLVQEFGPSILDDTTERLATMLDGLDDESPIAEYFAERLLEAADAAVVPVLFYIPPFSPESAQDAHFVSSSAANVEFWSAIARSLSSPLIEIETQPMTNEFERQDVFFDVIHMFDAGPFADVLVPRLCRQWQLAYPTGECS